jgi:hypothetical protein
VLSHALSPIATAVQAGVAAEASFLQFSLRLRTTRALVCAHAQVLVICHWSACLLGMLKLSGDTPLDTWLAKYGYCEPTDPPINPCTNERDYVCLAPEKMYLKTFAWSMGLITGCWSTPSHGPYDAHFSDGSKELYTDVEELVIVVVALISSAVWAYVTGKIVDIIANGDPDTTSFKMKMDDLNRFCRFYGIQTNQVRSIYRWKPTRHRH